LCLRNGESLDSLMEISTVHWSLVNGETLRYVKQRVRHSHGSLLGWRPCERKTTSPWLADAKLVDDHHQSERWRASVSVSESKRKKMDG
jgi:hypothetical protein